MVSHHISLFKMVIWWYTWQTNPMSFCSRSPLFFLLFRPSCDGNPVSSHYLPNISWLIKLNYPSFSWLTSTQAPPKNERDSPQKPQRPRRGWSWNRHCYSAQPGFSPWTWHIWEEDEVAKMWKYIYIYLLYIYRYCNFSYCFLLWFV